MTTVQHFPLATILTITDGRLLTDIREVYRILTYMTGDDVFTHQLPRAGRVCASALLGQHPQLAQLIDADAVLTADTIPAWLAKQVAQFGETLPVEPLAHGSHVRIDPVVELEARMGQDRTIVVDVRTNEQDLRQ